MERRRIIGIVLLALAGAVCLMSVVWNLIRMPEGADARIRIVVFMLAEVALLQPLIDPAGYRYITLGLAALTLVLIINIEVFKNTGWDPFGSMASTIAILAFCIVATVVMFWSMYKSIQK